MSATTHDAVRSADDKSSTSRRQHTREILTWALVYVEFGQENGGIALNLSEDGISVQAAMPLVGEMFPDMRLKGGPDRGWTDVTGRLVWTNETRKTAGIQFVDLSDQARSRIAGWIALERAPERPTRPTKSESRQATKGTALNREIHAGDAEQIAPLASPQVRHRERVGSAEAKLPPFAASASDRPSNDSDAKPRDRLFGSQVRTASPVEPKHWYHPRPPRARLIPANWNAGFYSIILLLLLAGVTFGTGLVLGSGVLGRFSKSANKTLLPQDEPAATANTDPANAPGDLTGALAAPDNSLAKLLSPPPSVLEPENPSPLARNSAEGLPRGASENDVESTTAPKRSPQSKPITPGVPARAPSGRSARPIPQQNLPIAANSIAAQSLAVPQKLVERAGTLPPSSFGSVQTQPVQPSPQAFAPATQPPNDAAQPQSDLRAVSVPNPAETTASSKVDPAAIAAPSAEAPPERRHLVPVTSPGHMDPGHLIHSVQPVYPPNAKKRHLEGNVELRLVVGTDGNVRSIQLVSGAPLLAPAAINAARHFRYAPALLNGQPIETIQTIDMSFRLKN